jgi:hypothetical protein|tara:strand:+ start:2906 stop:3163 length:258 start_codon:yes stop_codon:yes gene_type:complete
MNIQKWSDGSYFERTLRYNKETEEVISNFKEVENHALTISLHHTEDTWSMLNKPIHDNFARPNNKTMNKLEDNKLLQCMGYNPQH